MLLVLLRESRKWLWLDSMADVPTSSTSSNGDVSAFLSSAGVAFVLFLPVVVVATRKLRFLGGESEDDEEDENFNDASPDIGSR